jgi:DNA polymerase-3 subunit delta
VAGAHHPLTLALGGDDFLVERTIADAVRHARAGRPDADVTTVSAALLTAGEWDELVGPSLFTSHRVVVVTDLDQAPDDVASRVRGFVAAPEPDVTLVLTHPGATKGTKTAKDLLAAVTGSGAHVVPCDRLKRAGDVVGFVHAEVRRCRGTIDGEAASRLVDALGTDLRALAAACEQLVSDGDGTVTRGLVDTFFDGRAEVRGWAVADAAVDGDAPRALTELRWSLATGTDGPMLVGSLAAALRTMAVALDLPRGLREADAARALSVPPFKVRAVTAAARGWSRGGVAAALQAVARADVAVKGGANDTTLTLTTAVLDVVAARRR